MKTLRLAGVLAIIVLSAAFLAQDTLRPLASKVWNWSAPFHLGQRPSESMAATPSKHGYRQIDWDDLIPPGWDPAAALKGLNLGAMSDFDPRAIDALARAQEMWNKAPVNPGLDKSMVRIAGYVVPLETRGMLIDEFLLVPYFGACIHTPPPPSNQIIHVRPRKPYVGVAMDTVWVTGEMEARRIDTAAGNAGYHLSAEAVEPYKRP